MTDKLDQFLDDLQKKIFDEAKEVLGDKGFHRWQNPKFRGKLIDYDAHAHTVGACGDSMDIYFKFNNERVSEASYITDGCGSSNVCGSFASELSLGKRIEELADITGEFILSKLGDVAEEDQHCAFLAAGTVQEALKRYYTSDEIKKEGKSQ